MTKIKVAVAGCLGRMGQEIIRAIIKDKRLIFVGGYEHKSHLSIIITSQMEGAITMEPLE